MFFAYIDPGTEFTVLGVGAWLIMFLLGFLGAFLLFFKKLHNLLKRYKRPAVIILLTVMILTLIAIGANMSKRASPLGKKIIILGFDGLSPKIIEPMMEQGRLPNFSRLKERGAYRHLSTTNPSQSPVAWAGFATGQNPGKNGVFDFIVRDPKTYGLSLSISNIEKGKPKQVIKSKRFWQYASEKKISSVIITCPVTFPPDKIMGRMLSGMGVPDILGTEGTFTFYTTEPLSSEKDYGGKVFQVKKAKKITMGLIGPRTARPGNKAENTKVPFKVTLREDNNTAVIEHQGSSFELKAGEWSGWKEVVFKFGPFRKAKGIFKFYLVETFPEFKLYISPINFDLRDPFFQISYPQDYSDELAGRIGLYYTRGMPTETWAVNEKRIPEKAFLEQAKEVLREKEAMLDLELTRFEDGVLFCYFGSPDIIQHMFWRYTDSEHPLYEKDALQADKDTIRSWYIRMDNILGRVMKKASEKDTLIVLSDHGFDTFRRIVHINSWLRKNGYLKLKDPGARSGSELLADIDWPKTKAYSIGFGAIYINQQGQEREGIVKPGSETESLKKEISTKLEDWPDEKYNCPVINKVYPRESIFWGDRADQTPDLYVGFNIGYRAS